jgi:hypothetical protein
MTVTLNDRTTSPIPSQQDPVIDRYRRFTTRWWQFLLPLLRKVNDNSVALQAVSEDLTSATAAITTEQTVRAAADTALASQITTVSTTVDSNTASITTLQTSVDGIEARYAVIVNVNGNVVGAIRLDGTPVGSAFTVEADTFLVAQPGVSGGEARQIFGIGTVDGTALLGLRGDAIIDGSITARTLSVGTLSAITADLGTVTAGRIQSADGRSYWDLDTGEFSIGTA